MGFGIPSNPVHWGVVAFFGAGLARARFRNAVTLIALQWLALHHERIRRAWLETAT